MSNIIIEKKVFELIITPNIAAVTPIKQSSQKMKRNPTRQSTNHTGSHAILKI